MFTQVVIINYQAKTDDLALSTTLPRDLKNVSFFSIAEGVNITFDKANGDLYGISVERLNRFFDGKNQLRKDWSQIMTGKPMIRRVETTQFVQGLFDWVRQFFTDHQEKAPELQWGFKQQTNRNA